MSKIPSRESSTRTTIRFHVLALLVCHGASALEVTPNTVVTGGAVRFLVVRHGETDFNAAGRIQGTLDSELTPRGREQASALGKFLARTEPHSIDCVLVSPKVRAMQTLDTIVTEHPALKGVPTQVRPGLREIELTAWEGMARDDVMVAPSPGNPNADGVRWASWKDDPVKFVFDEDGHAPLVDLWERCGVEWDHLRDDTAARQLADQNTGTERSGEGATTTVLVVAHGAYNRALLLRMLGLPLERWRDDKDHFLFDNCECAELEWTPGSCAPPLPAHADRWRRNHPARTPWITRGEEEIRAGVSTPRTRPYGTGYSP